MIVLHLPGLWCVLYIIMYMYMYEYMFFVRIMHPFEAEFYNLYFVVRFFSIKSREG